MTWASVDLELSGPQDAQLPHYDYTKLSAINTCPTWGIVRYSMHKTMPGGGRSMALEAGTVMHEAFSLIRLIQLGFQQGRHDHMHYHGNRLFGLMRWSQIIRCATDDLETTTKRCAVECLETSGYTDDPRDKRRTLINLETSLLYYCQRWDHARYPVWIRDAADPSADIGIEIPFAVKVTPWSTCGTLPPFLYTGRIDGLHHASPDESTQELLIQENKTASRIDDAWRQSFDMSHQVTGYMVAASLFSGYPIQRGLVLGLTLPLPKSAYDGLAIEGVRRLDFMKAGWLRWLEYTIGIHDTYRDNPHTAPRHTHSCNRYFRPCSLIPFCAQDEQDQKDILDQMVTEEWTPLAEKAGD